MTMVIIATDRADAREQCPGDAERITKLGVVTADVDHRIGRGIRLFAPDYERVEI